MVISRVRSTQLFSMSIGEKVGGAWLFHASCLALLLKVTAAAVPLLFFALLLGGMVEVEKYEKRHGLQVTYGVRLENMSGTKMRGVSLNKVDMLMLLRVVDATAVR